MRIPKKTKKTKDMLTKALKNQVNSQKKQKKQSLGGNGAPPQLKWGPAPRHFPPDFVFFCFLGNSHGFLMVFEI